MLNYRPNIKWYLFQDDDVYIRGPALVALLSRYDPDRAMSISGHNNLRGFAPGMWPVYREKGCFIQFSVHLHVPLDAARGLFSSCS